MRLICVVLFAIGAAHAVSTNLRSTAGSDGLRAVVNLYHAAQAGQGPLIGEATLQDTNKGCVGPPLRTLFAALTPRVGAAGAP